MAIDTEKIKKAFSDFESEDYVSSEETIKSEVHDAVMDHLKTKLKLKNDIEPKADNNGDED